MIFNPKVFNEDNYYAGVRYPNGMIDAFHIYKYNGSFFIFDYEFDHVATKPNFEQVKEYLNEITGEEHGT